MNNKFPLFENIENPTLRTWNICATVWKIAAEHGMKEVAEYFKLMSKGQRERVGVMFERIKFHGYEQTRSEVNRTIQNASIKV